MDRGLWQYTRHPNHFGDALMWWGFFAIAMSTPHGLYTVISPILMTYLLVFVSGVPRVERSLLDKAGVGEYLQRTRIFFPWAQKETESDQRKRRRAVSRTV